MKNEQKNYTKNQQKQILTYDTSFNGPISIYMIMFK